ncbi:MAG: aminotransferase class IV [Bacteriovorax sp.]|nr:aminotransferase class IV [Bacteriovorax sp.]
MKILSSEMAQHYQISSLQRGHLIFTSFISYNGKILFLDSHLERLVKGADFLFPDIGWSQNFEKIKQYVEGVFKNTMDRSGDQSMNNNYFRLTIFDDCLHLQQKAFETHNDSLKLMSALKVKTAGLIPPFVKLSNYLESDLELARAKFKSYDDVLFFDYAQNITEASTSNIFIVTTGGAIITPTPSSIILDGVTRKKLLEKLQYLGFNIKEAPVSKSDLLKAREIWLTNSVKGVRFVEQFEELMFDKNDTLFQKVITVFGRYGELV